MRVGLAVDALTPELTGIGRYCWELTTRLPYHSAVESTAYYRGTEVIPDPEALLRRTETKPRRSIWSRKMIAAARQLGLGRQRHDEPNGRDLDVFHGPNYMLPGWVERGIITVHDLSIFKFPETHPDERRLAFCRQFYSSLDRAAHIVTDCETVRNEVIEFVGCSPAKVTAVPLGVARHLRPLSSEERLPTLELLELPANGYGLTLSAIEPRKRINRLLAAWRLLPNGLRRRHPLVIAGAAGWNNEAIRDEIGRAAAEGWLIPLGFVAEADLPALYSGASLFVYPSLYEGFGLPPLEAMATGIPTMVAAASCLPEVTQGAAMQIDPEDVPGFARAIERALEDDEWRQSAISSGIQTASLYTWERCVDETVAVYRNVLRETISQHD